MNVQTLPREMTAIKSLFLPQFDGFLFADYKAIEMRVLGYYLYTTLGDSSLVDEFKAGQDPHTNIADKMGITRQMAKTLNFSIIYLGGVNTIMKQLLVTRNEALELLKNYHATRPGIKKLVAKLEAIMYARGLGIPFNQASVYLAKQDFHGRRAALDQAIEQHTYIKLFTGRMLHPLEPRKALNMLIQGTAAELLKLAMLKSYEDINKLGLESRLVLSVHDELGWDVKYYEINTILEMIPIWMQDNPINKVVPTEVEISHSYRSWADKYTLTDRYGIRKQGE